MRIARPGKRLGLVFGLSAALLLAAPLFSSACSGEYDPNVAALIAEGRVERVMPRPDLRVDPAGAFTPVEVALSAERTHRGRAYYLDDGSPTERRDTATFVVRAVEFAYVEAEATTPRQIMQPYYVFRDEQGATMYVPAVASPHIEQTGHP